MAREGHCEASGPAMACGEGGDLGGGVRVLLEQRGEGGGGANMQQIRREQQIVVPP